MELEKHLENKEIEKASEIPEPSTSSRSDEASSTIGSTDTNRNFFDNINKENLPAAVENPENESSDETCSICARPIHDYVPKYFQDLLINPACSECDDSIEDTDDDDAPD